MDGGQIAIHTPKAAFSINALQELMLIRLCQSSLVALSLALIPTMTNAQSLTREPEETGADALENVAEFSGLLLVQPDPVAQVGGAMAACALAVSDPDAAKALFTDAGWTGQPAEDGETIFAATGDATTFVSILDAGTYCALTTTAMGTADAMKNYFDVTNAIGWPPFDWADDGNLGCLQADMDADLHAQITAANDECASETDAKITFTIPEGN